MQNTDALHGCSTPVQYTNAVPWQHTMAIHKADKSRQLMTVYDLMLLPKLRLTVFG
jgi:hypothetical protein